MKYFITEVSEEEFLELPPLDRVDMMCYYIGAQYNKLMEDALNMAEETQSSSFTKRLVDILYEEFITDVRRIVSNFNELCKDVIVTDVRFGEIDPKAGTCEIIPTYVLKGM